MELGAVLLVRCEIFRREHDGMASEAVTKGVEGYPALTLWADGAAGMGGVLAVDFGAIDGCGRVHKKASIVYRAEEGESWVE